VPILSSISLRLLLQSYTHKQFFLFGPKIEWKINEDLDLTRDNRRSDYELVERLFEDLVFSGSFTAGLVSL
jgi:hypothetical protein